MNMQSPGLKSEDRHPAEINCRFRRLPGDNFWPVARPVVDERPGGPN
jgi:hypothetical protein